MELILLADNSDVLYFNFYFFITIVFYNLFMERCTQISRLRDNKVLLYCIVLYCIVLLYLGLGTVSMWKMH